MLQHRHRQAARCWRVSTTEGLALFFFTLSGRTPNSAIPVVWANIVTASVAPKGREPLLAKFLMLAWPIVALAVLLVLRAIKHLRNCRAFWSLRLRHGGDQRATWRRELYDDAMYRGCSRAAAHRWSSQCEWLSGYYATRSLVLTGAVAYGLLVFHSWLSGNT